MTLLVIGSVAIAAGWVLLACLLPYLRPHHRPRAFWSLVAVGVPVLGWLTLNWGPMLGVTGFALGLAFLFLPPRREGRDQIAPPLD